MTNPEAPVVAKKVFYTLVTGELLFIQDGSPDLRALRLNTMLRSSNDNITAHQLGRAQQALQLALFQKLNDPKLVIKDVVIMNLSHMGYMTEEEFAAVPEGMQVKEKAPE